MMDGISVIILTLNEERNIDRCLRSVSWADEVIVVDSFSTDRTMKICAQHGARTIRHEYDSDLRQRERGFADARNRWLLVVDADEEIPANLADEIRALVAGSSHAEGYFIPRKMMFMGRWILHGGWYPGHTFRLFLRDRVVVEDAAVHGGYTVRGEKGYLVNPMLHYSYDSLAHYIGKMNDYTSLQVSNVLRSKPGYRPGLAKLFVSPLSHFVRNYFTRRGFRDGFPGFLLAVLDAVYALALYAKLWEYRTAGERGVVPPVNMDEIRSVKKRYSA
jgi:glycosyltransferase involved in cell wall biosynthesis